MDKPRLLDLFCGAGGAARGYQMAGFYVVGVDNRPQRHYIGEEFVQADALEYVAEHGREFDAIHASPPCQHYTRLRHLPWLKDKVYWRSIPPTREAILTTGKPYVIENVEDAAWDMVEPITLCGTMFGLRLFRHRNFETPYLFLSYPHSKHEFTIEPGHATISRRRHGFGKAEPWCEWMTRDERSNAVPPVMTRFIGIQLLAAIKAGRSLHP